MSAWTAVGTCPRVAVSIWVPVIEAGAIRLPAIAPGFSRLPGTEPGASRLPGSDLALIV